MSSSRRKQIKPRSVKAESESILQLSAELADDNNSNNLEVLSAVVDENQGEDFDEDVDVDDGDGDSGKNAHNSSASFNEVDDQDDEPDDDGLLMDMSGEVLDLTDHDSSINGRTAMAPGTGKEGTANSSANANNASDSSPFECHICHRKFKHRRSKSRHVMYHTGQKRHFCRYCNASFYRSDHLKAHTRTHTMPGILDVSANIEQRQASPKSFSRQPNSSLAMKRVFKQEYQSREDMCESSTNGDSLQPPSKLPNQRDDMSSMVADPCASGRRSVSSEMLCNFSEMDHGQSASTPLYYPDMAEDMTEDSAVCLSSANTASRHVSGSIGHTRPAAVGHGDGQQNETSGQRRCPFCQSSFATADQLRRHLREENCTLHPDAGLSQQSDQLSIPLAHQNSNSNSNNNSNARSLLSKSAVEQQRPFAVPEPVLSTTSSRSSSGGQLTCPLCPPGQQQQFSQTTMLIMHLACEHRFTQECLLAAIEQQQQQHQNQHSSQSNTTTAKIRSESPSTKGLPSFVCQCCDLSTANLAKFHQHMFSAHLKFFYRCSLCHFSAAESEMLAKHFLGSHCQVVVNSIAGASSSPASISPSLQHGSDASSSSASGAIDFSNPSSLKQQQVPRRTVTFSASVKSASIPFVNNQRRSLTTDNLPVSHHGMSSDHSNHQRGIQFFVCPICSLSCSSRNMFLEHMVTVHSWARCLSCPEVFTGERALVKHMENEHRLQSSSSNGQQAPFLQTLLQNSNSSKSTVSKSHHHAPYHGDSIIQCLACSRTFRGRLAMKQHLIQFHHFDQVTKSFVFAEEVYFVCDVCPDVFRTASVLAEHKGAIHSQSSQQSSSSNSTPMRRSNAAAAAAAAAAVSSSNNNNCNSHNTPFSCHFCQDVFAVAIDLEKHMVEKHSEDLLKSTSSVLNSVAQQQQQQQTTKQAPRNKPQKIDGDTIIRCHQCSSAFDSQYALEMHTFEEHLMNAVRANGSTSVQAESDKPANGLISKTTEETAPPPKRFQCSACEKIFVSLPSLVQHRVSDHDIAPPVVSAPLRCSSCRIDLNSLSEFLKHADVHKGSNNLDRSYYACCLCNEYLRDSADLTNHAIRTHFVDSLTCIVCDSPLSDVTTARSVRLPGSTDLVYCCANCFEVDAEQRRCNLCNAVFDTLDNLKSHNAKYHPGTACQARNKPSPSAKPPLSRQQNCKSAQPASISGSNSFVLPAPVNLQCSLCDTVCQTEEALTLHFIEHSHPDGNYQCPICSDEAAEESGRVFDSSAALDEHVRGVHGLNTVGSSACLCTECNRAFLWPAELNHHMAQHALEREEHASQPVPGAAQTKAVAAALQTAVANAASLTAFSCNVCLRSFPTVRSLANHQRQCLSRNRMANNNNNSNGDAGNSVKQARVITDKNAKQINGTEAGGDEPTGAINADPSEFLRCSICKNKFANSQSLQKHARTIHGVDSAEFWCTLCDSKLVNYKQLLHHLSSEHDVSIAQSVCELCGDAFTMAKNLKRHMRRVHSAALAAQQQQQQEAAIVNSSVPTAPATVDSPSLGTSEESPEVTVADD